MGRRMSFPHPPLGLPQPQCSPESGAPPRRRYDQTCCRIAGTAAARSCGRPSGTAVTRDTICLVTPSDGSAHGNRVAGHFFWGSRTFAPVVSGLPILQPGGEFRDRAFKAKPLSAMSESCEFRMERLFLSTITQREPEHFARMRIAQPDLEPALPRVRRVPDLDEFGAADGVDEAGHAATPGRNSFGALMPASRAIARSGARQRQGIKSRSRHLYTASRSIFSLSATFVPPPSSSMNSACFMPRKVR